MRLCSFYLQCCWCQFLDFSNFKESCITVVEPQKNQSTLPIGRKAQLLNEFAHRIQRVEETISAQKDYFVEVLFNMAFHSKTIESIKTI
jgi:hypothetical protein